MYKDDQIKLSNVFTDVEDLPRHLVNILYSAFYFALSFILLTYLSYAIVAINAKILGYSPYLTFNGVDNLAQTTGWSIKRIAFVYLSAPLSGLVISILSYYWYVGTDHKKSHLQQFFFWLSLNGFVLFYSYIITGLLSVGNYSSRYFTGFVAFFSWLEWSDAAIYGVQLAMLVLFVFYANRYAWPILKSSYSRQLLSRSNGRTLIFTNLVVLPFAFGSVMVFAATFPMDFMYQIVRLFSYAMVFLIMLWSVSNRTKQVGRIQKGGMRYFSPLWLLALLGGLILISRFLLTYEVKF